MTEVGVDLATTNWHGGIVPTFVVEYGYTDVTKESSNKIDTDANYANDSGRIVPPEVTTPNNGNAK